MANESDARRRRGTCGRITSHATATGKSRRHPLAEQSTQAAEGRRAPSIWRRPVLTAAIPAPIVPWDPNVEFYEGDRFGEARFTVPDAAAAQPPAVAT